jgi:hypothetical protein
MHNFQMGPSYFINNNKLKITNNRIRTYILQASYQPSRRGGGKSDDLGDRSQLHTTLTVNFRTNKFNIAQNSSKFKLRK